MNNKNILKKLYKMKTKSLSSSNPVYPANRKKKLWTESWKGRTMATHTHIGERGQRSLPARKRYRDVGTREKKYL